METKTCFMIGQVSDFNSEKVKTLAEKGGAPEYLDSCDLEAEFGASNIMTENDMSALFKDESGKACTGAVLEQRLEFLENYVKVAVPVDPLGWMPTTDNPLGFFKNYLSDISKLHQKYQVPYFEKEAEVYTTLLKRSLTSKQYQKFDELFMLGCQDTDLPKETVVITLAASLFSYFILGAANSNISGFVKMYDDCMDIMPDDRQWLFVDRFKALNGNRIMEMARHKLAASKLLVKEGEVLNIPAIKTASKKNKATVLFGWASWCPYCIKSMPAINDILSRKGVGVVGIIGGDDDTEAIARHRKENKISWKDINLSEADFMVLPESLPFFMVVDKRGVVKKIVVGAQPGWEKQIEQAIQSCF